MIHETLFYLWKKVNSESEDWSNLFELQEFLHPAEKKLLNMIVEIASNYHGVVAYVSSVENRTRDQGEGCERPGLYETAFANGVNDVLKSYRREIVELENKFLQNPQLPLTYILSCTEKYNSLFSDLLSIIKIVQDENLYGCLIMGKLHRYLVSGNVITAAATERMIRSINVVFYGQLAHWVIYGELADLYSEFFIKDHECPDEDFMYPDQTMESQSSTTNLFKKSSIRRSPIVRKFSINWGMVPTFIDEGVAESILFMGRIVWIVRNDPKKIHEDKCQLKYKRDIWEGQEVEYYKKIQRLETDLFNDFTFRSLMEECRMKLTKYLWSLMLDEGNVVDHLQLIRDYYALGRGELFQQFMVSAENYLKDTSSDTVIQNLNIIFMETAIKLYGENDKSYQRFELITNKSDVLVNNPWAKLQITFEIKWPLHVVFHPKAMELYNKLFSFLLHLKKAQINLQKLWQLHVSCKDKIDRRVWTLRHNLLFLLNSLQYYIQVDVIEANFSVMLKAIKRANEFEDIIKVHHEFISNLLAKSFVLMTDESNQYKHKHRLYHDPAVQVDVPSPVYNIIMELLNLCDEFALVASTWDEKLTAANLQDLETIQKRADSVIEMLLYVLYSLHVKANGQHLYQLINQLNFNGFYSKSDFNLYH